MAGIITHLAIANRIINALPDGIITNTWFKTDKFQFNNF